MNALVAGTTEARADLDRLLGDLRPKLHRYCARMTGSVVDGEDVVQEALIKAIEALPQSGSIAHPEAWVFRIAHNAALDFLRRRARQEAAHSDQDPDMIVDPATPTRDEQIAAASLHTFMRLPAAQRSSVILMDVLGYIPSRRSATSSAAAYRRSKPRCIAVAPACACWRRSLTTGRCPFWLNPSVRFSPPMSSGSTRAISTPYATCWLTRCASSSSPGRA